MIKEKLKKEVVMKKNLRLISTMKLQQRGISNIYILITYNYL